MFVSLFRHTLQQCLLSGWEEGSPVLLGLWSLSVCLSVRLCLISHLLNTVDMHNLSENISFTILVRLETH